MIIENSQVANVDVQKAWWECIFLISIGLFWEIGDFHDFQLNREISFTHTTKALKQTIFRVIFINWQIPMDAHTLLFYLWWRRSTVRIINNTTIKFHNHINKLFSSIWMLPKKSEMRESSIHWTDILFHNDAQTVDLNSNCNLNPWHFLPLQKTVSGMNVASWHAWMIYLHLGLFKQTVFTP